MSVARLMAVIFIFCCSTMAWFVLGASVAQRSGEYDYVLEAEVAMLWGGRHEQGAPQVFIRETDEVTETVQEEGGDGEPVTRRVRKEVQRWRPLALAGSEVDVALNLEHRRKGLLWYDLYAVDFDARYSVVAPMDAAGPLRVSFVFPAPEAIYDGFYLRVDEQQAVASDLESAVVVELEEVVPGATIPISVAYRSRGLDTWTYAFRNAGVGQVHDFALFLTTDFDAVDFLPGTLSPTLREPSMQAGELITWRFENLVTGKRIGVDLPNKLNPGPLTRRVTFFAPVSLLFFLTVMIILGVVQGQSLHPMHYFFIAAAFFSFHLLLAYLVDHISIHVAFVIAAVVSLALVVSYLRIVGGTHFALARAGLAQLVYLVLFNYAFFFRGFTGLAITLGAIVTLFVLMQITAPVDWSEVFGGRRAAEPVA